MIWTIFVIVLIGVTNAFNLTQHIASHTKTARFGSNLQIIYTYKIHTDPYLSYLSSTELGLLAKVAAEIWNTFILCGSNYRVEEFTNHLSNFNVNAYNLRILPPFPIGFQLGEYLSNSEETNYTERELQHTNKLLDHRQVGLRKCLYSFVRDNESYDANNVIGHSIEKGYIHLSTYKFINLNIDSMLMVMVHEMGHAIGFADAYDASFIMGRNKRIGPNVHLRDPVANFHDYFSSSERQYLREPSARFSSVLNGGWISYGCSRNSFIPHTLNKSIRALLSSRGFTNLFRVSDWDDRLYELRKRDRITIESRKAISKIPGYWISSDTLLSLELKRMHYVTIVNFFDNSIVIPSFNKDTLRYIIRTPDGICWSVADRTNEMWRLNMAFITPDGVAATVSNDIVYPFLKLLHSDINKDIDLNVYFKQTIDNNKPYSRPYRLPNDVLIRNNPTPDIPLNVTYHNYINQNLLCNDEVIAYRFIFGGQSYIVTTNRNVHSYCGGVNHDGMPLNLFIEKHICDKSIHMIEQRTDIQNSTTDDTIRKIAAVVDSGPSMIKGNEKQIVYNNNENHNKAGEVQQGHPQPPPSLPPAKKLLNHLRNDYSGGKIADRSSVLDYDTQEYTLFGTILAFIGGCTAGLGILAKYLICNKTHKEDYADKYLQNAHAE